MASATVFPDGRIEDKHLKNLCALFDVVHIGMPWMMEPTQSMKHALKLGIIEIHRPAEVESRKSCQTLPNSVSVEQSPVGSDLLSHLRGAVW